MQRQKQPAPAGDEDVRADVIDYVRARAAVHRLRGKPCDWHTRGELSERCAVTGPLDYDEWCQPCRDRHDTAAELAVARRAVRRLWARIRRMAERAP